MGEALFRRENGFFVPDALAGSPWGPGWLHGGPPAALLAYGVELEQADRGLFVSRMTIDLFRPVPKAPLELRTETIRAGKRIQVLQASLWYEGVETCRATALLLRTADIAVPATAKLPTALPAEPAAIETGSLMPRELRRPGMREGFHTTIEVKRVTPPNLGGGGRHCAWIRIPVPIIEGVETTPLMRVAGTSDFGNGLANIRVDESTGFINADISLYLARPARGEWICLDAESAAESTGLGLIRSAVYDEQGLIGHCLQATLANPRQALPHRQV